MSQKAPKHLQPATAKWWRSVVSDYELQDHHIRLLTAAAESWDRAEQARELLAVEGLVQTDRFGQKKPHPAVAIERDAKGLFARLLRELALDVDSPAEPYSRPSQIQARKH